VSEISKKSEFNLLSYLVKNPNYIFDIDGVNIEDSDFSTNVLRNIYRCIKHISAENSSIKEDVPIDPIIAEEYIAKTWKNDYERNADKYSDTIDRLIKNNSFDSRSLGKYVSIIVSESYRSKIKKELGQLGNSLDDMHNAPEMIETVEKNVYDFTSSLFVGNDLIHIGSEYEAFIQNVAERAIQGEIDTGISTGFDVFDEAVGGGLRRGTISVIAARPKRHKCVNSYETMIYTSKGILYPYEMHDVVNDQKVDEIDYKLISENGTWRKPAYWWNNGIDKTKKITTKFGYEIEATHEHPIKCIDEGGNIVWKNCGDIRETDVLVMIRGNGIFNTSKDLNEDAYVLGLLCGDGHIRDESTSLTTMDECCAKAFSESCSSKGFIVGQYTKKDNKASSYVVCDKKSKVLIDKEDLYDSDNKKIMPLSIRTGSKRSMCMFIRGLFDADGGFSDKVHWTTNSSRLHREVKTILLALGIVSSSHIMNVVPPGHTESREYYQLSIRSVNSMMLFKNIIGFGLPRKMSLLNDHIEKTTSSEKVDVILNASVPLNDLKNKIIELRGFAFNGHKNTLRDSVNRVIRLERGLQREFLNKVLEEWSEFSYLNEYRSLKNLASEDILYQTIKSIEDGECLTCDYYIDSDDHSFVANGFINHNSFLALTIANNVSTNGVPVLYLDTELSEELQMSRLTSIETGVPLHYIETGKFVGHQGYSEKIKKMSEDVKDRPFDYVQIAGWSIEKQVSIIRHWFAKRVGKDDSGRWNNALVILDYLKLMNAKDKNGDKEYEALGFRISQLHDLMRDYDNPMLALAQQNRSGIEVEDSTTISGSDRIIWLCDNFSILSKKSDAELRQIAEHLKETPEYEDQFSNMKLNVVECRHGPGCQNGEFIGLYCDFKDFRKDSKECNGKLREVGLERPMSDEHQ